MNRMKLNYSIDLILTILFIVVAVTGFVLYLVIPSGVQHGRYQEFLGITKSTWTLIHNRSAILMTLFTGIHLILHKKWICCVTKSIITSKEDTECSIE
ncbi:MAG: DUF4405 domain-containing protein [Methanolobus sp.]